ncbi:hypothetical protein Anapl_09185 [Anas platyrhynchos]|uniref:Uncharacterized protein n=1 Tax=Anas platyrhynchos TaxID=8839 RepID=R0JC40_ANAPL|nr:hypothetical protein Anapl_09185 [Anas platyrhynchos]
MNYVEMVTHDSLSGERCLFGSAAQLPPPAGTMWLGPNGANLHAAPKSSSLELQQHKPLAKATNTPNTEVPSASGSSHPITVSLRRADISLRKGKLKPTHEFAAIHTKRGKKTYFKLNGSSPHRQPCIAVLVKALAELLQFPDLAETKPLCSCIQQQRTGKPGVFGSLTTAGGKQRCRNESNPFPDHSQIYAIHVSSWYTVADHIKL